MSMQDALWLAMLAGAGSLFFLTLKRPQLTGQATGH